MMVDYKKIGFGNKVVFETTITSAPQSFSYPLKDEACFIHVKQGHNIAFTPDEMVDAPEGNLAFANSGNLIFKTVPNEDTGLYQATVIHIHKEFVLEAFSKKFPTINTSGKPNYSRDMVTGKPCVIVNNYIEGILYYFDNPHMVNDEIVKLKVKEILLLLLQSKKAQQVSNLLENFVNRNTVNFKTTVETHLYNDISLTELAHLCNMSLSTFKRHFKKIYKTSPSEYIFDRRLEKSRKLLATSELSVMDVALNSGFKTMSHYSKKFKDKFGIPPSQYKLTRSGK